MKPRFFAPWPTAWMNSKPSRCSRPTSSDPGAVTVEWTAGNDHDGYAVLSQAISEMVEQHWNALRSQVLKKKESEVQATRKEWSELTTATVPVETSTVSCGPSVVRPWGHRACNWCSDRLEAHVRQNAVRYRRFRPKWSCAA